MLYAGKLTVGKVEFSVSIKEAFTSTRLPEFVVSLEIANTTVVKEARIWHLVDDRYFLVGKIEQAAIILAMTDYLWPWMPRYRSSRRRLGFIILHEMFQVCVCA